MKTRAAAILVGVATLQQLSIVHADPAAESDSAPVSIGIADVLARSAGHIAPELRAALADKPSPYIVKAHDVGVPTDFNKDIPWHLLDKEKDSRFHFPTADRRRIEVFNTNSSIHVHIGIMPANGGDIPAWKYTDHMINMAALHNSFAGVSADALLITVSSDTLLLVVTMVNQGTAPVRLGMSTGSFTDQPNDRPTDRFGYGIHSTTGRRVRGDYVKSQQALVSEYEEWDQVKDHTIGSLVTTLVAGEKTDQWLDPSRNASVGTQAFVPTLDLPAGGTKTLSFAFNVHRYGPQAFATNDILLYPKETPQQAQQYSIHAAQEALRADWPALVRESFRWYERMPVLELPVQNWARDTYCALELPRGDTWSAQDLLPQPWYTFCRVHGHNPYGWWSYGMHGHEHLSTFVTNLTEPTLSQSFLRGHFQVQRPDGFIQYGVNLKHKSERDPEDLATAPLLAWESWNAYLWSGDRAFLQEAYDVAGKNIKWWRSPARTRAGQSLQHWKDYIETVRDDRDLATWRATGTAEHQEALDLNCYLLNEERTLAAMARELHRDEDTMRWQHDADARTRTMQDKLWHAEDRVFYGRDLLGDRWARVQDISTFLPLWCGLATPEQAASIVKLLHDPEAFGTDYPVATLAVRNMPEKKKGAYHWRGANWVEMTWLVVLGLKRYGYHEEAARLTEINCRMVYKTLERTGHFREFYNALNGNPSDLTDYIWTSIPAAMVVDIFFGIRPTAQGIELAPALPHDWTQITLSNLHCRAHRIALQVQRTGDGPTTFTLNGHAQPNTGANATLIAWERIPEAANIKVAQPRGPRGSE